MRHAIESMAVLVEFVKFRLQDGTAIERETEPNGSIGVVPGGTRYYRTYGRYHILVGDETEPFVSQEVKPSGRIFLAGRLLSEEESQSHVPFAAQLLAAMTGGEIKPVILVPFTVDGETREVPYPFEEGKDVAPPENPVGGSLEELAEADAKADAEWEEDFDDEDDVPVQAAETGGEA